MGKGNWRDESGLSCEVSYRRNFAVLPVTCSDGVVVWMGRYYKKYEGWGSPADSLDSTRFLHTDFIENITEAEYIVRKLAENL